MYIRNGVVFGTYVHSILPQIAVYIGPCKNLDSEESPYPPTCGIGDGVRVFEVVFLLVQAIFLLQTMVIRFCAASDRRCLMCKNFVIECIDEKRPFPASAVVLEYFHVLFCRHTCLPLFTYATSTRILS